MMVLFYKCKLDLGKLINWFSTFLCVLCSNAVLLNYFKIEKKFPCLLLDTMASPWWDKCRSLWWNDIWRDKEKHAWCIWVCIVIIISLLQLHYYKVYIANAMFSCWHRYRKKDKLRYRYPRGESYLDVIQR